MNDPGQKYARFLAGPRLGQLALDVSADLIAVAFPNANITPAAFYTANGGSSGAWLLATGFWNDAGTWQDSANWID